MATGVSIHLGLNSVDPSHYQGWDGSLVACENDARSMQQIAVACGFEPKLLLTRDATSVAVLKELAIAAQRLGDGDTLFISYSGHGGQIRDVNGDEDDGQDETWVLYDRMLIDDELYAAWSNFHPGVRAIMLSDSCHSGTVAKALFYQRAPARRFKAIPQSIAEKTYEAHRTEYDALQWANVRGDKVSIGASILLISGCQDNQLSADGDVNGLFTEKLLGVWKNGRFRGNYYAFWKQILAQMPVDQSPNYYTVGKKNSRFENERPFTITSNGAVQYLPNRPPSQSPTETEWNPANEAQENPPADLTSTMSQSDSWLRISRAPAFPASQFVSSAARKSTRVFRAGGPTSQLPLRRRDTSANAAHELRQFILGIDKIPVPADTDLPIPGGTVSYQEQDGHRLQTTSAKRSSTNTFESIAAFDVHADVVWPGSVVQGNSLTSAILSPIAFPRAAGTIVVTNLTSDTSAAIYSKRIDSPSLGAVQEAMRGLLQQQFADNTAARISFVSKQFYSLEHAMMQIGASVSWLTGSARASLSNDSYASLNNYVVQFLQAYYSVSLEPPAFPESLFAPGLTADDAALYMGPGNPPVYISTVTYGRMLLLFASSSSYAHEVKETLDAAFSTFSASGDVQLNAQQQQILRSTEIKVLALGGPSSGVVSVITDADKAQGLKKYLVEGMNFTRNSPGVPISYEARYLRDNSVAKVAFTTDYEIRTAVIVPILITAVQLRFHTLDDDKDDSAMVNVEFAYSGQLLYRGSFGGGQTWHDHTDQPSTPGPPWTLPLSARVPVESVRNMTIRVYQTQDNTGWNMSYDVWGICDDGTVRHIGGHGARRVGDDCPGDFTDSMTGG